MEFTDVNSNSWFTTSPRIKGMIWRNRILATLVFKKVIYSLINNKKM